MNASKGMNAFRTGNGNEGFPGFLVRGEERYSLCLLLKQKMQRMEEKLNVICLKYPSSRKTHLTNANMNEQIYDSVCYIEGALLGSANHKKPPIRYNVAFFKFLFYALLNKDLDFLYCWSNME